MSKQDNLKRLLAPRSVAFIGGRNIASSVRDCINSGFTGEIFVVSPKHEQIAGFDCVRTIADLPIAPDAAFIAVNSEATVEAVAELAALGTAGCVCYAAGFAEIGGAGAELQHRLVEAAGDMALVGPNCYGILNYVDGVSLWPDIHGGHPVSRGVAILSQSGNIGLNLTMAERSLPLAHVISVGNQAVLGIGDYIDALIDDDRVDAIGIYLEGLNDIASFTAAAARALEKGVPIVALKSGVSDLGAELTMSHTSSLAGSRELYQALFDRLGVIQVSSLSQMLEALKLLSALDGPLKGRRLNVLTCSGGDSAMAADAASEYGFAIPRFAETQVTALRAQLPSFASVSNPLDYNTSLWGNAQAMADCFATVMAGEADLTILVLDYPREGLAGHQPWNAAVEALIMAKARTGAQAAVMASIPELLPKAARERLIENRIAPLQGIDMGFRGLAAVTGYHQRRAEIMAGGDLRQLVLDAPVACRGEPLLIDEWHSKLALAERGMGIPPGRLVTAAEAAAAAAEIGFPVVVKAVSAALAHKTEMGAVKLNLKNAAEVEHAVAEIATNVAAIPGAGEHFLVEKMVPGAVAELILGVKRDPQFGLALVVGTGGILVNLIEDSQALILPATRADVRRALGKLKMARLLTGYRGKPAADIEAIVDAAMAVADYAIAHADSVMEMDVNPLFAMPRGQGAIAADALISQVPSKPGGRLAAE
ncbi:acetate--CoA ligase family protein [Paracoccus sp. (in: a-proteobacteria)]|uniref:acetate--CoA ligase family protein n=1 Tax=Paracoccus sp. TaxID=267 RepID=UPI00321FAC68